MNSITEVEGHYRNLACAFIPYLRLACVFLSLLIHVPLRPANTLLVRFSDSFALCGLDIDGHDSGYKALQSAYCSETSYPMGNLTLIFIISFSTHFAGQKAGAVHCRTIGRFVCVCGASSLRPCENDPVSREKR